MNTAGLLIAGWAMAGALVIGWALFRFDKWAQSRLDEVDDWMDLTDAVTEARQRHPASRSAGLFVCDRCQRPAVGHPGEHICPRVGA